MSKEKYLHGFNKQEQQRLQKQAKFLQSIVYSRIDLSHASHILEVGSGVGAQSEILLRKFPNMFLTGIDFSETQIETAKQYLEANPAFRDRYEIFQMDAMDMSFPTHGKFDAAFLCWVLEHIPDPQKALSEVKRVLQPGSPVYISEVLNSSLFLEPYSPHVMQYWSLYNNLQLEMGGDPFVGVKLGNMLHNLGYSNIQTEIKTFFFDNRTPDKRTEMIVYWTELLLSGLPNLLEAKHITEELAENVKREMRELAQNPHAVFFYSFIQARAESC